MTTFSDNSTGEDLPNIKIKKDIIKQNIVELIASIVQDTSKSEIRRLIKSDAVKIDNNLIKNDKFIIENKLFKEKGFIKLSLGKKKHFKIVI